MQRLIRRAVVVASAAVVVLVAMAGVASAGGTAVLGWSPSGTSDYGTLSPGATSPPRAFKLTNTGGSATSALKITVSPAAGTPASAFTKTADTCTGTSLGPKKSCSVSVTFTAPATPGSYVATLTVASNKPSATASVTLTGMSGKATPVITSAQQPATGPAGTTIADQATVTGPPGDSPTGTVTFTLYDNPHCNNPLLTDPEPLTNGVATGGGIVATGPGTAYWVASYGGDASNNPVTTGCADEPVTITQAQPAITTAQQPATATVGTAIADQATVTGGFVPSGTVTFTLYGNADCTGTLFTDTEQLPFDGTSVTSASYTATTTGTDYWVARYNGDLANLTATSSCAGEPVTITKATPTIQTQVSQDGTGNFTESATLSGGYNPTGTITFALYGPGTPPSDCSSLYTSFTVPVSGDGTYSSAQVGIGPGNFWWTVTYNGDDNNNSATAICTDQIFSA